MNEVYDSNNLFETITITTFGGECGDGRNSVVWWGGEHLRTPSCVEGLRPRPSSSTLLPRE